jgi:hypothetical protein
MSKAAAPLKSEDPFDPILLKDGRTVEWHLRVTEGNQMVGLDIRYIPGVGLPGIFSIDRGAADSMRIPEPSVMPGISEKDGAKDAVDILGDPEVREDCARQLGQGFLKEMDAFAGEIRKRYLG